MKRHRLDRRERKRKKKIIVFSMIGLVCLLSVGYATFSTTFNINGKGTIVEKSRVIQSWTETSNEDFHEAFYRENIVSATFLDSNAVPSTAKERWDVSENKDGGVMAYVVESTSETGKYDLFIGANKGVIANEDSSWLFYNFTNITSIDFKDNFDTSNVITMYSMFAVDSSLAALDLTTFDTSNLTNMRTMFYGCRKLISVDVSSFNTSKVTSMRGLFGLCNSLKSINVSNFDTSNVTEMNFMFEECRSIQELLLYNFDTSNVNYMEGMFANDDNIKELNLCSFDTSKVTNMENMFHGTSSLEKVYVGPNWTTANAHTDYMWTNSKISSVTTGQC